MVNPIELHAHRTQGGNRNALVRLHAGLHWLRIQAATTEAGSCGTAAGRSTVAHPPRRRGVPQLRAAGHRGATGQEAERAAASPVPCPESSADSGARDTALCLLACHQANRLEAPSRASVDIEPSRHDQLRSAVVSTFRDGAGRTEKARATYLTLTAHRAVDDPVRLARAVRIVRAAIARQRVSLRDLTPLPAEGVARDDA